MPGITDFLNQISPGSSGESPWSAIARGVLKATAVVLLVITCFFAIALVAQLGREMVEFLADQQTNFLRGY